MDVEIGGDVTVVTVQTARYRTVILGGCGGDGGDVAESGVRLNQRSHSAVLILLNKGPNYLT